MCWYAISIDSEHIGWSFSMHFYVKFYTGSHMCIILLAKRIWIFCTQRFSLFCDENSFADEMRRDEFLARWIAPSTHVYQEKMSSHLKSHLIPSHHFKRERNERNFVCIGYRLKCKCGCFMFFFLLFSYVHFKVATTNVYFNV